MTSLIERLIPAYLKSHKGDVKPVSIMLDRGDYEAYGRDSFSGVSVFLGNETKVENSVGEVIKF